MCFFFFFLFIFLLLLILCSIIGGSKNTHYLHVQNPRHAIIFVYVMCSLFCLLLLKFVTENRLRARMRATPHWLKGPATSNPSAGFSCGNEGRSEATWPRFMPCIGPQIPGMIKVYLGTVQKEKSYFYFNFCATKDDQY